MTQVSFRSKQIQYLFSPSSFEYFNDLITTVLSQRRWRKRGLWLIGSTSLTLMVAWDWKLVLATIVGAAAMIATYQIQVWDWRRQWSYYREFLKGFSGKLILAVGSGSLWAIIAYVTSSIWASADNHWLAMGLIIQEIVILFTLGLSLWQIIQSNEKSDENQFNQWVLDLTSTDPLKRLIAVKNLVNFLRKQCCNNHYHKQLGDYFKLMLTKEIEQLIRQVILEGLVLCNEQQVLNSKNNN